MLNTPTLREQFRQYRAKHGVLIQSEDCYAHPKPDVIGWVMKIGIALVLSFIAGCFTGKHAMAYSFTDDQAILAIMGECEGEPYMGKIAVAETIINRGSLKGIYGYKAIVESNGKYYRKVSKSSKYYKRTGKLLRHLPSSEYESAKEAWKYAKETEQGSWNATHWENVSSFGVPYWAKKMVVVAKIGNHVFYREII